MLVALQYIDYINVMYLFEAITFIIKTSLIIYTQIHWELKVYLLALQCTK